jgi:signal transduction histidine kinase/DNA-binding response OmpR family regulator/ligand-binding sensor domain-containing protein
MHYRTNVYFLSFIALILSAPTTHAADVKFYNINDTYKISMRETTSLCRDDDGFIWASSKTGILRLTGDDCRIYRLPYETANVIRVKLVCQGAVLVAYTNNGQFFLYNKLRDRFDFLFDICKLFNYNHIWRSKVLIDKQGAFWIASSKGLHKYSSGKLSLISNPVNIQLAEYDDRHLLLIKSDSICLMDVRTTKEKCLFKNMPLSVSDVNTLFYDRVMHRLWIGSNSNGLFYYDIQQGVFSKPDITFPKQPVLDVEANTDSTLLIGTDGQGIWELNKTGNKVLNIYVENVDNPSSLRGDGIYDILYDDHNRRVWVCTFSGGVSFFNQASPVINHITHQINNPNSLCNNNVNKILEDSDGNIWFATDNGISRWDVSSDKWYSYYRNKQEQAKVFLSICEDNQGRIWAGTYSSGVYVLDKNTGKELARYSGEDNISYVFDIFKDSQGDLWIGGNQSEVCCWIEKEKRFRFYQPQSIGVIIELSPGKILLGCTYGLVLLDKQTGDNHLLHGGYLVQDILEKDRNIWICTIGEGLVKYDIENQTIQNFTTESGLISNYVNSILYADGYLWIGTENGLCRFNPDNHKFLSYPFLSLSSVSFNRSARCILKNGQLVWGTNNGVILFDPRTLQETQSQGRIFFQDLVLSGRSIRNNSFPELEAPLDHIQEFTLKYNQNTLSMELLPIGSAISGSKFSWKMDGLDAEWTKPSNQRIITYSNLPNGNFRLKIRLHDSSLSQIIAERELVLHVTPPLWKTGWFRLIILLLIAGIIYFSSRYYIDRLKQRHAEDKIRFFTNMAHDIRTSITLIKAPIEELNKKLNLSKLEKHYLHLATEQARRLSSMATQLLDFQKADIGKEQLSLEMVDLVQTINRRKMMFESFASRRNIELLFSFNPLVYSSAIDEAMMEKVIDNLISNAVKYSHSNSRVQMIFNGNPQNWTLEVIDQGIGIDRETQKKLFREFYRSENAVNAKIIGSGIGLLLVKTYVELHKGTVCYVSRENEGSSFKITIPFLEVKRETKPKHTGKEAELVPSPDFMIIPSKPSSKERQKEMSILIVEDNADLRNFMSCPLSEKFDVATAEDGAQAWEIIQKQMPDLVVSDIMMPNTNGFELCKQIKSTYETSHIPIILLTALTGKTEQLHGLGLGADDYLTKPFDMILLSQKIQSIIQNRKIIREKALKLIDKKQDEPILNNELNDKFVKKAVEIVRVNMTNLAFGKNEFASAMNVSPTLLHTKIKSLTGQAPVNFINSIRLNYTLELLQSQKHTVTEVSEMCGFSDVSYFSKAFKKHFGKSPTKI